MAEEGNRTMYHAAALLGPPGLGPPSRLPGEAPLLARKAQGTFSAGAKVPLIAKVGTT